VLDAVGGVRSTWRPCASSQSDEEHLLALAVDVVGLLQEGAVVDDALVEGPGVLGEAERAVGADPLLEVRGVVGRMRDRHGRLLGVDVEGRDVEREVLVHLRHHHPALGLDLQAGRGLEGERHPVRELAGREVDTRAVELHARPAGGAVEVDGQRRLQGRPAVAEDVIGTLHARHEAVAVRGQGDPGAALLEPAPSAGRVVYRKNESLGAERNRACTSRRLGKWRTRGR
jgi:hypothetical protein